MHFELVLYLQWKWHLFIIYACGYQDLADYSSIFNTVSTKTVVFTPWEVP